MSLFPFHAASWSAVLPNCGEREGGVENYLHLHMQGSRSIHTNYPLLTQCYAVSQA